MFNVDIIEDMITSSKNHQIMFDNVYLSIKNLFKPSLQASVDFIMELKYHYQYNCYERFFFEDISQTRYYAGGLGSNGYNIWKDAKKGDKIHIMFVDGEPVKVELMETMRK